MNRLERAMQAQVPPEATFPSIEQNKMANLFSQMQDLQRLLPTSEDQVPVGISGGEGLETRPVESEYRPPTVPEVPGAVGDYMGILNQAGFQPGQQQVGLLLRLMDMARYEPESLRPFLEDKQRLNRKSIRDIYTSILQQLDTMRPSEKPSIAGYMETNSGKQHYSVRNAPSVGPVETFEPGDITRGRGLGSVGFNAVNPV